MARSDVFTTRTGGVEQQMRRDSMQRQMHISRGIRAQHYVRGMVPPSQQRIRGTGMAQQCGFFMGHGFAILSFAQHPSQEASCLQEMSHLQEAHCLQEMSHLHWRGPSQLREMSTEESEDQEKDHRQKGTMKSWI